MVSIAGDAFFIKLNTRSKRQMFDCEEQGLKLLKEHSSFAVPQPLLVGKTAHHSFLIMEYLVLDVGNSSSWVNAAHSLAELHSNTSKSFGLDHNNFIGSLEQSNRQKQSWANFFSEERITPLLRTASTNGLINESALRSWESISQKLDDIFPKSMPCLLHGDLWSGNISFCKNGTPAIYDPALYYGHFEMELAFTQLFGGFPTNFLEVYSEHNSIAKGFSERKNLYNLYPLLVHLNLFGAAYLGSVESILKKFN